MFAYVIERLAQSLLVLLVITLIGFCLFRYVGDPVLNMVGQNTSEVDIEKLRQDLGLNDSIAVQYFRYLRRVLHGNLGLSYREARPVAGLLVERFPASLELSVVSTIAAIVLALGMGVYAAVRPQGWLAQFYLGISLVGVSLPTFLIGILLILAFSVVLPWLPSFGRGQVVLLGRWSTGLLTVDGWRHLIMPGITLGLFNLALIMRLVRSEMLEVLRTDYIKFARARGLSPRVINFGHALRNTLIPVVTITGLQLGGVLAFAIITESVFQWPGIGLLFIQAVNFADLPVMSGYLLLIGLIFVVINLSVDLLYLVIDPRLREAARP
ncbi:MAG TPA: ABC transporter permease [bacterium]|nr:ABC transporter permease [bacterium]